jgi:hypothetical protein
MNPVQTINDYHHHPYHHYHHLDQSTNNNNTAPQQSSQHEHIVPTATAPAQKRTKSILKSPSTFSEKSIHFDDRINVIPIRSMNDNGEEDYDNEPGVLQTSSIIINEQQIDNRNNNNNNPDIDTPYLPVSNRSRLIKTYSYYSSSTQLEQQDEPEQQQQQQQHRPFVNFTNEIESIKKMLLEPKASTILQRGKNERNSISPAVVFMASSRPQHQPQSYNQSNGSQNHYNQHRSRTERIFIKSPTPMREIAVLDNDDDDDESNYENSSRRVNYLRVPSFDFKHSSHLKVADPGDDDMDKSTSPAGSRGNNRQRFVNKKKPTALRSQSVDLAKIMDNFENDDLSPPPAHQSTHQPYQPRVPSHHVPAPPPLTSNVHLKPGFVRAKAKSPSPRPVLTRQDAMQMASRSTAGDLTSIEQALKSKLAASVATLNTQMSGSNIKQHHSKHKHTHRNHRNRYPKNRGSQKQQQQRRLSHKSSSSDSSFSSSPVNGDDCRRKHSGSNSSLTSLVTSQEDLSAVASTTTVQDNRLVFDSNDSDSRYRRASVPSGVGLRSAAVVPTKMAAKRAFYYSSDDSVCGIPKPSVNKKKSPK